MKNAIEPSLRSVYQRAIDVIDPNKMDKNKKPNFMFLDNDECTYLTDAATNDNTNQYFRNRDELVNDYFDVITTDVYYNKYMNDWMKSQKQDTTPETLLRSVVETFDAYKPYVFERIKIDDKATTAIRPGFPNELLYFLQMVHFGLLTQASLEVFRSYFGEPIWTKQNAYIDDVHSSDFIRNLVLTVNAATRIIVKSVMRSQPGYVTRNKTYVSNKVQLLVRLAVLMDVMKTINKYGPNPILKPIDTNEPLLQAIR